MSRLAFANARAFDRAQATHDNAAPDDDEPEDFDEAAKNEMLRTGGAVADSLSAAAKGADYEVANLRKIGVDFYGLSAVQLLAVMADGEDEAATKALMQWRMLLPEVMANPISERSAELAKEAADAAEEAKIDAFIASRDYA